ncbi:13108_t:CDS:2 [Acaulospora colombiana]|uniref:13108_t:CDS:1 n=1 Tax=Acaulospora colombiana TaxID=27376 RepID=A0ACA9JX07_9GLOM|nr:13108_t:CDS:2 [Acaulospora colombiana]
MRPPHLAVEYLLLLIARDEGTQNPCCRRKISFNKCNYFNPKSEFDTDWTLDFYGFLTPEEFENRLKEINFAVRNVPLLSRRIKSFSDWSYGLTTGLMALIIAATSFTSAQIIIKEISERRAREFSAVLKQLFDQYNARDNPTANWKLAWRPVMTHIDINMKAGTNGSICGKAVPKFSSQALLVIEINDALSDHTAPAVHFKIPPNDLQEKIMTTTVVELQ